MQKESALEAQRRSSARGPNGLRRLSLAMLATGKIAEEFKGTTEGQGATRPGQVLAAFKAAAPHLGLSPRDCACDRLAVRLYPAARLVRGESPDRLAVGRVAARHPWPVADPGQDDQPPAGRARPGDDEGQPERQTLWQTRPARAGSSRPMGSICRRCSRAMAEFQAIAEQGRALRGRMGQLRRRCTIARNGVVADPGHCRRAGLHRRQLADAGSRGQGARPLASDGRAGRGNGAWRRQPGTAAEGSPRTAGKPARRDSKADAGSSGF